MNKTTKKFLLAFVLLLVFLVFTAAVKFIDVQAIGPESSSVGLASLNGFFFRHLGTNSMWYNLTKLLGYFAIACAAGFALIGLFELCSRRSLKKVDMPLIMLAVFYVLVGACYVLFEKVIINYRPVILSVQEGLEASYPSSHTMLTICIMGSGTVCLRAIYNDRPINFLAYVLAIVIAGFTAVGRLLAGVHWFTDIVGSILLSAALVELYAACVCLWLDHSGKAPAKRSRKSKSKSKSR